MPVTPKHHLLLTLLLLTGWAQDGRGAEGLRFTAQTATVTPTDDRTSFSAQVTFPFVNAGTGPVTIVRLRPSCPCLTPQVEKKTYLPGETGEIVVDVLYGSLTGTNTRTLEVVSDAASARPTTLEVVMKLPSGPGFTPQILHWDLGAHAEPKRVVMTIPEDFHHALVEVTSSRAEIVPHLHVGDHEGAPYVEVEIASTAVPLVAVIAVRADTFKHYEFIAQVGDAEPR